MGDPRDSYEGDVFFEVWRSGGNPDAIDFDRVNDAYYAGDFAEDAATFELHIQTKHGHIDPEGGGA